MIKTIFTIFHDFIDRLLVLIDIVRNCTSQIRAGIVFFCQNFVTECNQGSTDHGLPVRTKKANRLVTGHFLFSAVH